MRGQVGTEPRSEVEEGSPRNTQRDLDEGKIMGQTLAGKDCGREQERGIDQVVILYKVESRNGDSWRIYGSLR